jgi:membrane-associated phospholipid phosphatase
MATELPGIEREGPAPVPSMRVVILGSLAASVLALVLFSWLAEEVFEGGARHFDDTVRTWVHQFASPTLTSAMVAISWLGSAGLALVIMVALIVFLRLKWRRAAIWLLLAMAGGLILELAFKSAFHRARPIPFFGAVPRSYSFPSGHSLMSFCIYGVLAGLLSHRIRPTTLRVAVWIATAALVTAIGLSRIYLGVHYPSDVVAGYLAAAMWVSALLAADRVRKRRRLHATARGE